MKTSQSRYKDSTKQSRTPALTLQIDGKVFWSANNIRINLTSFKLDCKPQGPFPVKKTILAYAYELNLSCDIKLPLVLHVSLLVPLLVTLSLVR